MGILLMFLLDYPWMEGTTSDSSGAVVSLCLGDRILDGAKELPALRQAKIGGPGDEHGIPSRYDRQPALNEAPAAPRQLAAPANAKAKKAKKQSEKKGKGRR